MAFDAFYAYADQFVGLKGQSSALLSVLTRACEALSQSCAAYAAEIRARRTHIEHMAEAAGIATVAGAVLAVVTFGISDAVAESLDAGVAAELAATWHSNFPGRSLVGRMLSYPCRSSSAVSPRSAPAAAPVATDCSSASVRSRRHTADHRRSPPCVSTWQKTGSGSPCCWLGRVVL